MPVGLRPFGGDLSFMEEETPGEIGTSAISLCLRMMQAKRVRCMPQQSSF